MSFLDAVNTTRHSQDSLYSEDAQHQRAGVEERTASIFSNFAAAANGETQTSQMEGSLMQYKKILSSEKLADKAFMEKLAKFNQEKPIVSADELKKQNFGEGPKISERVDPIKFPMFGKLDTDLAQDIREKVPSLAEAGILPEAFEAKAFVRKPGEQRNDEHAGAYRRGRAASLGGQHENPQAEIHSAKKALDCS